jgi:hypothetical protein
MSTPNVRFSRFAAIACATVITATSAWAFVNSSASTERDPFNFGAVMAANAQVHTAQLQTRNAGPTCWDNSLSGDLPASSSIRVCRRG